MHASYPRTAPANRPESDEYEHGGRESSVTISAMADTWMTPERQRPPGWRFNAAAAEQMARELTLTAKALLDAAAMIQTDAPVVTEDWTGRLREVFDVESAQHNVAAISLADDMLQTAALVRLRAEHALNAWESCQ
jgi:hypothetical protein